MTANHNPGVTPPPDITVRSEASVSRVHQWIWTSAVSVLGGVGVLLTFYAVTVPAIVGTGLIGALVGCVAYPPFYRSEGSSSSADPRSLGKAAATGAAVALAVTGLVSLMGPPALLLAALLAAALALTSPAAVRRIARWRLLVASEQEMPEERPNEHHDKLARLEAATERQSPRELSTHRLCRAWRTSFVLLEHTQDARARALLSGLRQRYLDELERRDPSGFERWMETGARAASDPARYLDDAHDEPR